MSVGSKSRVVEMFVRVTSGHLFARLTSAPPGLRLELNFSIDVFLFVLTLIASYKNRCKLHSHIWMKIAAVFVFSRLSMARAKMQCIYIGEENEGFQRGSSLWLWVIQ